MIKISLAAARKNAKLTQKQAAVALGVSVSTVKNWEKAAGTKGKSTPNVVQANAICAMYGVPYDCIDFTA